MSSSALRPSNGAGRVAADAGRFGDRLLPAAIGLGLTALGCVLLRGNLLVLAPVVGVWAWCVARFRADRQMSTASGTPCRTPASKQCSPIPFPAVSRGVVALSVWTLALAAGGWRVEAKSGVASAEADIATRIAAAEQLAERGQWASALQAFRDIEIPQWMPARRTQKFYNVGVLAMRLSRWKDAEDAFLRVVAESPTNKTAWMGLARSANARGAIQQSETCLSKVLCIDPSDVEARRLLVTCLVREGQYTMALAELDRLDALTLMEHPIKPAIRELKEQLRRHAPVSP